MVGLKEAVAAGLLAVLVQDATAQDSLKGFADGASVTYGPYLRLEYGAADMKAENGYWHPPNYPTDPEISFDLSGGDRTAGGAAIGFDWQNGFRADLGVMRFGKLDVTGPCASASDGTPCANHADITDATVKSDAVLLNLFYSPLEQNGSNSRLQPFVVAGVGLGVHTVSEWTRENPAATRPVRVFEGATTVSRAWSIGAGLSWQATRAGQWPVMVELAWRYYDLGQAEGGATPLPGNGASSPKQPLSFDNTQQTITLGVRIPLKRY